MTSSPFTLIEENSKLGTKAGGLTRSGWGALKTRFSAWIKSLMATGKDVVIVTHGKEGSARRHRRLRDAAGNVGGSKGVRLPACRHHGVLLPGRRQAVLQLLARGRAVGKNPAGWKAVKVGFGTSTFAKLLKDAKAKIGKASVGAGVAAKAAAKPKGKPPGRRGA